MDKIPQARNYIKEHKKMSIWYKLVISMASVVVFLTTYMLILPAITMEKDAICGIQMHTHTDECYMTSLMLDCELSEGTIIPLPEDSVVSGEAIEYGENEINQHIHSDVCYVEQKNLVCGLEEHIHTDKCYPEEKKSGDSEADRPTIDIKNGEYGDLGDCIVSVGVVESPDVFESLMMDSSNFSLIKAAMHHRPTKQYTVKGQNTKYDSASDSFDSVIRVDFTTTKAEIVENGNVFIYQLPEEIKLSSNVELDTPKLNQDGEAEKFYYSFALGEDGHYYIVVEFREEYLDTLPDEAVPEGYVQVEVKIGSEAAEENGSINIGFGDDVVLDIPGDEIEYPINSTASYDITSAKSGKFDSDTNTLSYTVKVYSEKGTPETISFDDQLANLNGLTIENYSVTVKKAQQQIYTTVDGSWVNVADFNVSDVEVPVNAVVDTATGKITMDLPGLSEYTQEADPTDPDSVRGYYKYCDAYEITYTYTLAELAEGTSVWVSNDVNVSTDITSDLTIESEANTSVRVTQEAPKMINKTAVKSGDAITWTITVGDGKSSLENGLLTDDMFSEIKASDISVIPDDVSASPAGLIIVADENGNVSGIKFNEGCELQYKITYSTPVTNWNRQNFTNTAVFTDGDGGQTGSTATIGGVYAGGASKSNGVLKSVNNDGTRSIEWTATFNVPIDGIPAGMVITDELKATDKGHYVSYDDAVNIADVINSTPGLAGNVGNLQFYSTDGNWYAADSIQSGMEFTSFKYEIVDTILQSDCGSNGETSFSYSYTTTIDTTGITDAVSYGNYMSVPDRWLPDAYYDYSKKVIKMDASGKTSDSSTSDVNGNVKWIVRVNVDTSNFDTMSVIDSLPENVDLTKLEISVANYNYTEIPINGTAIYNIYNTNTNVVTSVDSDNNVNIDLSSVDGETRSYLLSENGTIYLRYTCKIKDEEMPTGESKDFELTNSVEVNLDGTPYDVASQKQTLTVDKSEVVKDAVDKGQVWDRTTQKINCSVDLNPYGEDYSDGDSYEFIDTLKYNDGYSADTLIAHRKFELDVSSLKLYYAKTETYVDDDGKTNTRLVKDTEVDVSKWSYVYEEKETDNIYNGSYEVSKIITAQFPDETPLIFEYAYTLLEFEQNGNDAKVGATNTAIINEQIIGNSDKSETTENWESAGSSAGIKSQTYTLYKVSTGNYNDRLAGAKFKLYAYNAANGKYEDSGKEFISDSKGLIEISVSKDMLAYNTMYYIVEVEPPQGYKLPDDPEKIYFYVSNNTSSVSDMPDTLPEGSVNLTQESPTVFMENNAMSDVPLVVDKKWYSFEGEIIEPAAESVAFKVLKWYKPRQFNDDKDMTDVSYNIADTYNIAKTGSTSFEVGSEAEIVITYHAFVNETWRPGLQLQIGNEVIELPDANNGEGWNGDTYTHRFVVTEGMTITGKINSYDSKYTVALAKAAVAPEDDPDYIKDGTFSQTYTLSDANSWETVVNGLPAGGMVTLADGTEVYADFAYSVEEITKIDGFETTYDKSEGAVTIKNTKEKTVSLNVDKQWYGLDGNVSEPGADSIVFRVLRTYKPSTDSEEDFSSIKDETFSQTYTLSDANSWTMYIDDLPAGGMVTLDDGTQVYADFAYYVEEVTQFDNYVATYDESEGAVTIKNTEVEKKYIEVIKKWLSYDGAEMTKAAGEVSFNLYKKIVANESNTVDIAVDIAGSDSAWMGNFTDSYTFAKGTTVNLVIASGNVWWWPALNIQVGSDGSIVTSDYNSTGWNIDYDNSVSTYTYQFVVSDSTSEITGTIGNNINGWTVELVEVAPPPDSGEDDSNATLATELVGTYTVEGPEWTKKIDVTQLPTTGTYTKADGTVVPVIYTYYVEEVPLSGYITSYENNEGINEGTIIIKNTATEEQDFVLPETGGTGTNVYTIGGLLIMLCAVYFLYIRKLRQGGGS